jgi:DNA-binding response OmpR family regulator
MRILIVEDDSRVARFIEKGLQAERFHTDVEFDGRRGFESALTGAFDLVILDLMLPGKKGIEVCRQLRGQGVRTPLLMLTAKDALADKITGFEAGADDYLTKPFAFEELLARIKALGRRGSLPAETGPVLQIADLMLDHDAHEVGRADKRIELTPKEFALLEYLMRHPRRVLSRAMIEEQVWGYQEEVLTNVVDVYVRRLRKKVDCGFQKQLIHTIRGIGYQLKMS